MHCALLSSLIAALLASSCGGREQPRASPSPSPAREETRATSAPLRPVVSAPEAAASSSAHEDDERYREPREELLAELRMQGIDDARVLDAIRKVPRHRMVPDELRAYAYGNHPLPIGHDQTISQPFIVALMTKLADVASGEKVLEIGTGSGYQAAVLAELGATVYSIEVVEPLGREARRVLDRLGYGDKVQTRIGDGYRGWPEAAPFDAIVITAAPPTVPEPLKQQLAVGGKLVVPVGEDEQELVVLTKTKEGFDRSRSIPVRFVPMTGEAQRR